MANGADISMDERWKDELDYIWKQLQSEISRVLSDPNRKLLDELTSLVKEQGGQLKAWLGVLREINGEDAQEQNENIDEILEAIKAIEQNQVTKETIDSLGNLFGFCVFRWNVAYNELYYYDLRSKVLADDVIENIKRVVSVPYGSGTIGFVARNRKWKAFYLPSTRADIRGAASLHDLVMGDKAFMAMPVYEDIKGDEAVGQLICIICCFFPVELNHGMWEEIVGETNNKNWFEELVKSRRLPLCTNWFAEQEYHLNQKQGELLAIDVTSGIVGKSEWYQAIRDKLQPESEREDVLGLAYWVSFGVREDVYVEDDLIFQDVWWNPTQFQRAIVEHLEQSNVVIRGRTKHQREADQKDVDWHESKSWSSIEPNENQFCDYILSKYHEFFEAQQDLVIPIKKVNSTPEEPKRVGILKFNCFGAPEYNERREQLKKAIEEANINEPFYNIFHRIREKYNDNIAEKELKELEILLMNLIVDYMFLSFDDFQKRYALTASDEKETKERYLERILQTISPALKERGLEDLFFVKEVRDGKRTQSESLKRLKETLRKLEEITKTYKEIIQAVTFWYVRGEQVTDNDKPLFRMYHRPVCSAVEEEERQKELNEFLNPATYRVFEFLINQNQPDLEKNPINRIPLVQNRASDDKLVYETLLSYEGNSGERKRFEYLTMFCFQSDKVGKWEGVGYSGDKIILAIHHSNEKLSENNTEKEIYGALEKRILQKGEEPITERDLEKISNWLVDNKKFSENYNGYIVSLWVQSPKSELVAMEIDADKSDKIIREKLKQIVFTRETIKYIKSDVEDDMSDSRGHLKKPAPLEYFDKFNPGKFAVTKDEAGRITVQTLKDFVYVVSGDNVLADLNKLTVYKSLDSSSHRGDLLNIIIVCSAAFDPDNPEYNPFGVNSTFLTGVANYASNQLRLQETSKLKERHGLAVGMIHQVRNNLAPVEIYTNVLESKLFNQPSIDVDDIKNTFIRQKKSYHELKTFINWSFALLGSTPERLLKELIPENETWESVSIVVHEGFRTGLSNLVTRERYRPNLEKLIGAKETLREKSAEFQKEFDRLERPLKPSDLQNLAQIFNLNFEYSEEIRSSDLLPYNLFKGILSEIYLNAIVFASKHSPHVSHVSNRQVGVEPKVKTIVKQEAEDLVFKIYNSYDFTLDSEFLKKSSISFPSPLESGGETWGLHTVSILIKDALQGRIRMFRAQDKDGREWGVCLEMGIDLSHLTQKVRAMKEEDKG